MKQKAQISSLTALRGIAAIWVMFFHIDVLFFYRDYGAFIPHNFTGIITKGYLWVDFFFLLSGFIISYVYGEQLTEGANRIQNILLYVKARFYRLYPLHLFTLLILVIVFFAWPYIFSGITKDGSWQTFFAPSAIIDNVFMIHAMNQHTYLSWNIVSWSIAAEFWTYIIAIAITPFVVKYKWKACIAIVVTATIILFCLFYNFEKKLDITFNYGWLRCLAEFSLGIVVYFLYLNSVVKQACSRVWVFPLVVGFILMHLHFNGNDLIILPLFGLLLLSAAVNTGNAYRFFNSKILTYLGRISFSIYMMHGVWFMIFWFTIPYLKSYFSINFLYLIKPCIALLFIAITLLSAGLAHTYVEVKFRKR
jgi:peptidoglycan/LPS O-acetylase OafA/YrhL